MAPRGTSSVTVTSCRESKPDRWVVKIQTWYFGFTLTFPGLVCRNLRHFKFLGFFHVDKHPVLDSSPVTHEPLCNVRHSLYSWFYDGVFSLSPFLYLVLLWGHPELFLNRNWLHVDLYWIINGLQQTELNWNKNMRDTLEKTSHDHSLTTKHVTASWFSNFTVQLGRLFLVFIVSSSSVAFNEDRRTDLQLPSKQMLNVETLQRECGR